MSDPMTPDPAGPEPTRFGCCPHCAAPAGAEHWVTCPTVQPPPSPPAPDPKYGPICSWCGKPEGDHRVLPQDHYFRTAPPSPPGAAKEGPDDVNYAHEPRGFVAWIERFGHSVMCYPTGNPEKPYRWVIGDWEPADTVMEAYRNARFDYGLGASLTTHPRPGAKE